MLKSIIVDTEWPQNPLANFTFSKEYTIETKIELPKCYVLAIANYKGQFALEVGKTSYSDIKNALIGRSKEGFWTSKGNEIFMINSPMLVLTDKDPVGGEEAITHLQILAPCSPKPTAEESAKATNRAKIFLERILGKVEVTTPRDGNPNKPYWSGWTYTVPTEGGTNGDKVTFISWGLDVTNTTTYPIRRIEEEWIGYPSFTGMGTSSNVDQSGTQAFAKNRFIGEYK